MASEVACAIVMLLLCVICLVWGVVFFLNLLRGGRTVSWGGVRIVSVFTRAFCGGQLLPLVQGTVPISSTWPVRFREVGFRIFTDHWKEIRICCRGLLEKTRSQTGAPSVPVGLLKRARPRQGAFIAQDRSLTRARPQVGAPGILFSPLCHCL